MNLNKEIHLNLTILPIAIITFCFLATYYFFATQLVGGWGGDSEFGFSYYLIFPVSVVFSSLLLFSAFKYSNPLVVLWCLFFCLIADRAYSFYVQSSHHYLIYPSLTTLPILAAILLTIAVLLKKCQVETNLFKWFLGSLILMVAILILGYNFASIYSDMREAEAVEIEAKRSQALSERFGNSPRGESGARQNSYNSNASSVPTTLLEWETYKNNFLNFSIDYPSSFSISEIMKDLGQQRVSFKDSDLIYQQPVITIDNMDNPSSSLEGYWKNGIYGPEKSRKSIMVNNKQAFQIILEDDSIVTSFKRDDKQIFIIILWDRTRETVYNKMLDSFKY
jgi:hypothetical protein